MTMPDSVAVTGPLGFVGRRLVPRLVSRGVQVVAIVRPGRDAATHVPAGVEVRYADLSAPAAAASELWRGVDAVVHLAGMSLASGIVPALEGAGVRRAVFVSSAGVFTRLASPAAEAKRQGERSLRESGLEGVILRPSMIYGAPGDRNLERLLAWIERWPVVFLPGGGSALQQPVHVTDLVGALERSLERPEAVGKEYDLGGPVAFPLSEMVRIAAGALGRHVTAIPIPLWPVHVGAVLSRRLGWKFPVRPEQLLRLRESKAVEIAPARADLGFDPREFSAGIAEEVAERSKRGGGGRLGTAPA